MSSYLFVSYSSFFIRFSMNIFDHVFFSPSRMLFALALPIMAADTVGWWAQVDSNHRPRAYQARALTTWAMSPCKFSVYLVSLHPFLLRSTSRYLFALALSMLGCRLCRLVEMMGIEPMTPCLQGRCSPSWATPPFWGYLNSHWKLNNNESRTLLCSYFTLVCLFGFALLKLRCLNTLCLTSRSP